MFSSQIDSALTRIYIMLLFTNIVVFVKSILQGYLVSQIFNGIMVAFVLGVYIYSRATRTIALSMIEDTEFDYDPSYSIDWWNFYKHPLTAMARSKVDIVTADKRNFVSPVLQTEMKNSTWNRVTGRPSASFANLSSETGSNIGASFKLKLQPNQYQLLLERDRQREGFNAETSKVTEISDLRPSYLQQSRPTLTLNSNSQSRVVPQQSNPFLHPLVNYLLPTVPSQQGYSGQEYQPQQLHPPAYDYSYRHHQEGYVAPHLGLAARTAGLRAPVPHDNITQTSILQQPMHQHALHGSRSNNPATHIAVRHDATNPLKTTFMRSSEHSQIQSPKT